MQETNLDLLHVVVSGVASKDGTAPTLTLCRGCHDSIERDLISKNISGWDHFSKALFLAMGQSGFNDDEMKTLKELLASQSPLF